MGVAKLTPPCCTPNPDDVAIDDVVFVFVVVAVAVIVPIDEANADAGGAALGNKLDGSDSSSVVDRSRTPAVNAFMASTTVVVVSILPIVPKIGTTPTRFSPCSESNEGLSADEMLGDRTGAGTTTTPPATDVG